jgi:hypothetical protein
MGLEIKHDLLEHIERNGQDRQGGFLSGDRIKVVRFFTSLRPCFRGKSLQKKYLIPMGVNVLAIRSIKKQKAKNGADMYVVEMTKPSEESTKTNASIVFDPIRCYHLMVKGKGGNWYDKFTMGVAKDVFENLKPKHEFKALVGYKRDKYKGVVFDKPFIKSVHRIEEDVKFDWFDLYIK